MKRVSIAILSATLLIVFGAEVYRWRNPGCHFDFAQAQLHSLAMKIQAYELDTRCKPTSLDDLLVNHGNGGWKGPYARAADLRDAWHRPIEYEIVTTTRLRTAAHGSTPARSIEF